ncbi:phospholipase domain-containing protein [Micromonospora sp. NPDC051227]|uniref:phospholipase domain-containing protein n=1 Tax=Micromonospora sp. NPDC051227 TaxID=3364285 RepID=UPI0037A159B9
MPVPYTLHADGHHGDDSFRIDFRNSGGVAAVFQVRQAGSADAPRSYTVEPGKQLTDTSTSPPPTTSVTTSSPSRSRCRCAPARPSAPRGRSPEPTAGTT